MLKIITTALSIAAVCAGCATAAAIRLCELGRLSRLRSGAVEGGGDELPGEQAKMALLAPAKSDLLDESTGGVFINMAADMARNEELDNVVRGCMAEHGYVLKPIKTPHRRAPAPTATAPAPGAPLDLTKLS